MALGAGTVANFSNATKVLYPQKRVDLLFYEMFPFMAMMTKKADFVGDSSSMKITVQWSPPAGGRSADFTAAQTYISTGQESRFSITRRSDYQIARLSRELIDATENDLGSLIKALQNRMDNAMKNLGRNLAGMLWRNGGGARGRVATGGYTVSILDGSSYGGTGSKNVLVLADPESVALFEVDMALRFDANDGTGASSSASTAVVYVGKVDRSNGRLWIVNSAGADVDVTTVGVAADDYIFQEGDFGAVVAGVPQYIPYRTSTQLPGTLFGLDRNPDPDRLAGTSFDGSTYTPDEALKLLSARILRNSGRCDTGFINPLDFADVELSLGSRVQYVDLKPGQHPNIGFTGIKIATAQGAVPLVADLDCPRGYPRLTKMADWEFHHLKGCPHQQQVNGGRTMTLGTADQEEFRQVYRGNLVNVAPMNSGVVKLASAA